MVSQLSCLLILTGVGAEVLGEIGITDTVDVEDYISNVIIQVEKTLFEASSLQVSLGFEVNLENTLINPLQLAIDELADTGLMTTQLPLINSSLDDSLGLISGLNSMLVEP